MTNDEIAGRLVTLETITYAVLTNWLADCRATGSTTEQCDGYISSVRNNVKAAIDSARLDPRAAFHAMEIADRLLDDASVHLPGRARQ